jgi:hypothetical protein
MISRGDGDLRDNIGACTNTKARRESVAKSVLAEQFQNLFCCLAI